MSGDVLVLNADYQPINILPLSVISWQQAIKLCWVEKAQAIHYYDDWHVHSPTASFAVPSVIVNREYFNTKKKIRFTRKNMYIRDMYQCQYCADMFDAVDLTMDHVIPRSLGGDTSWENCVTACGDCNHHKGDKLIKPVAVPHVPDYYQLARKYLRQHVRIRHESWHDYIRHYAAEVAA